MNNPVESGGGCMFAGKKKIHLKWNCSDLCKIYSSLMCMSPFPQQPQAFYSSAVVILSPQLTIYLGKRDFVDNIGNVEPVGKSTRLCAALPALNPVYPLLILIFSFLSDGVVLVDPAIIKGKKGLRFYAIYVSEIVCLSE